MMRRSLLERLENSETQIYYFCLNLLNCHYEQEVGDQLIDQHTKNRQLMGNRGDGRRNIRHLIGGNSLLMHLNGVERVSSI